MTLLSADIGIKAVGNKPPCLLTHSSCRSKCVRSSRPRRQGSRDFKILSVSTSLSESQLLTSGLERCERLRNTVILEERAAYDAFMKIYRRADLKSLKRQGVLITNLTATPEDSLYRMHKIQLQLRTRGKLPQHRFGNGDAASLSLLGQDWSGDVSVGEIEERTFDVTIHKVGNDKITVIMDSQTFERFHRTNPRGTLWRLDSRFQNITSLRQLVAIEKLKSFEKCANSFHVLQSNLLGIPVPQQVESRLVPMWLRQSRLKSNFIDLIDKAGNLNESQKRAIKISLEQRITLWQGPPGSGKTHTLLALLEVLCKGSRGFLRLSPTPILVCAETNAAVDNLVYGLLKRQIRVVRVGLPSKTRETLLSSTLDARIERTKNGEYFLDTKEKIEEFRQVVASLTDNETRVEAMKRIEELEKLAEEYYQQACEFIFNSCEVVACTCNGAGDSILSSRRFSMVVMDEATQSTEPCALIPLMMGAQSLVMAGDPEQLPPTVLSKQALDQGLDHSLFARLGNNGFAPLLLDTQYRMHPEICFFPSTQFYDSKLKTDKICEKTKPPQWFKVRNGSRRVKFVNSSAPEERTKRYSGDTIVSYRNNGEARIVVDILQQIVSHGDVRDIAVLTPYKGQMLYLDRQIEKCKKDLSKVQVYVSTGREADVVIFTTVRSNQRKAIGFVSDKRRTNVAITRAKRGLIVVGNQSTLASNEDWKAWLNWVTNQDQNLL